MPCADCGGAYSLAVMYKALLTQGGKIYFAALRLIFSSDLSLVLTRYKKGVLACVVIFTAAAAQAQIFSDDEARATAAGNTQKIETLGRVMNNLRTQLASMLQQQQTLEQDLRELSGRLEEAAESLQSAKKLSKSMQQISEQQNILVQEVSAITVQISLISESLSLTDSHDVDGQFGNVNEQLSTVDGKLGELDGQFIALSIKLFSLSEQMSELVDIIEIPSENDMYGVAFSAHQRRDYAAAISGFQKVVRYYPQGAFALNARYWMTQALLENGDYVAAEQAAEEILNNNAASEKTPEILLALARAQQNLEKEDARIETLNRLIEDYPTSLAADKARQMLLP